MFFVESLLAQLAKGVPLAENQKKNYFSLYNTGCLKYFGFLTYDALKDQT